MKVFEVATAVLLTLSVVYFVDWLTTEEPVKQCYHKVIDVNGSELGAWLDCTEDDLIKFAELM